MHHQHHSHVLQLDIQGTPQAWISLEHAAVHVATGSVAWCEGTGPLATLRGGFNHADNPIPDALVNPLFPATVKSHYALGAGWRFSATGELNASLTIAPTSKVTNGMGVEITHKQTNLQLMYSRQFL